MFYLKPYLLTSSPQQGKHHWYISLTKPYAICREAGQEPKAFLLPLLVQSHPSPLSHFIDYFVPLSEQMFDLQQTAESHGRQSEAKVWSVLVGQVWAGLVGYCHGIPDLKQVSCNRGVYLTRYIMDFFSGIESYLLPIVVASSVQPG